MATGPCSLSGEPNELECPACSEHFTAPKLLPCGHLYCRGCVIRWLNSHPEASCPTCRCPIVTLRNGGVVQTSEQIADDLPTDLAMEALAGASRLLDREHTCCVHPDVAAVSTCLTCGDMFCTPCGVAHKKQAVSRHHDLRELASLTAQTLATSRPISCQTHDNRLAEMHCSMHQLSLCGLCAAVDHQKCPDMMTLESTLRKARTLYTKVMTSVNGGVADHAQVIGQLDEDLLEIDRRSKFAVSEAEAACDRLESAVKAYRVRLREMADGARSDGKRQVQEGKSLLQDRLGKLALHKKALERSQLFSEHGFFPTMVSRIKERVDDLHLKAFLPSDVVLMTLFVDPEAVLRIEKELSQLGYLHLSAPLRNVQNATLVFHPNHGTKVKLSDDTRTAWRTSLDRWDGIVLSRDAMREGLLYQVVVDEINADCHFTALGVVTENPGTLTLPAFFTGDHPTALCVQPDGMYCFGRWKRDPKWPMLENLPTGSKVGLAVHRDSSLHLYVDEQDKGGVCPEIPQPCYFMFHLRSRCTKIRALPARQIV